MIHIAPQAFLIKGSYQLDFIIVESIHLFAVDTLANANMEPYLI